MLDFYSFLSVICLWNFFCFTLSDFGIKENAALIKSGFIAFSEDANKNGASRRCHVK